MSEPIDRDLAMAVAAQESKIKDIGRPVQVLPFKTTARTPDDEPESIEIEREDNEYEIKIHVHSKIIGEAKTEWGYTVIAERARDDGFVEVISKSFGESF